jgi:FtsP/CotA-like multicopper oxidase with cupredoxin domain
MLFLYLLSLVYGSYAWSTGHHGYHKESDPGPHGGCTDEWEGMDNYDTDADRVYYIACVEEQWNYCPSGWDLINDVEIKEGTAAATWCLDGIGAEYWKGLYRQYEGNCFEDQIDRSDTRDEHLGALGPNIRLLSSETVKIFYKNTCSFPNSMHSHGLFYEKHSEGAPYKDHDGVTGGDLVAEGERWIYIWKGREKNVDEDFQSKMWLYHSHVDEVKDVNTGLFGAIIVTKDGKQRDKADDLRPQDVDEEFATFMVLYDENNSHLYEKNLEDYTDINLNGGIENVPILQDPEWQETNLMHAINGYLFGNLQTLIMSQDDKVRWYTASFGNEGDGPHSPHWHGNIVVDSTGDNKDTVVLIPGTTDTVTMDVDNKGKWLYHCHVHDHIEAGMITTYLVTD